jgi:hypothetical protein
MGTERVGYLYVLAANLEPHTYLPWVSACVALTSVICKTMRINGQIDNLYVIHGNNQCLLLRMEWLNYHQEPFTGWTTSGGWANF